jgi:hypothetical protein
VLRPARGLLVLGCVLAAVVVAAALAALGAAAPPAHAAAAGDAQVFRPSAVVAPRRVAGGERWRGIVRFRVRRVAGPVGRARLVLPLGRGRGVIVRRVTLQRPGRQRAHRHALRAAVAQRAARRAQRQAKAARRAAASERRRTGRAQRRAAGAGRPAARAQRRAALAQRLVTRARRLAARAQRSAPRAQRRGARAGRRATRASRRAAATQRRAAVARGHGARAARAAAATRRRATRAERRANRAGRRAALAHRRASAARRRATRARGRVRGAERRVRAARRGSARAERGAARALRRAARAQRRAARASRRAALAQRRAARAQRPAAARRHRRAARDGRRTARTLRRAERRQGREARRQARTARALQRVALRQTRVAQAQRRAARTRARTGRAHLRRARAHRRVARSHGRTARAERRALRSQRRTAQALRRTARTRTGVARRLRRAARAQRRASLAQRRAARAYRRTARVQRRIASRQRGAAVARRRAARARTRAARDLRRAARFHQRLAWAHRRTARSRLRAARAQRRSARAQRRAARRALRPRLVAGPALRPTRARRVRVARCRAGRPASCRRVRQVTFDVTRAVRGNGRVSFAVSNRGSRPARVYPRRGRAAPRLVVSGLDGAGAPVATAPGSGGGGGADGGAGGGPPRPVAGVWTSAAELASRPTSGPAWQAVKSAADGALAPAIANQDDDTDVRTMAAALVYARTGDAAYRAKVATALSAAIGSESGGRTLALGRNLVGYVVAADLIHLSAYDGGLDARFRGWLGAVRHANLDGDTLVSTHEGRPNNWGTMAGASRIAADVYLGDQADLDRAAKVFAGFLGDRASYAGFSFGDLSWQADPSRPVGVNPPGAVVGGLGADGALPDDMRRGCGPQIPPCHTDYAWEALQGVVVQAQLLARRGYDAWHWSGSAVLRAARFLQGLDQRFGGWWAAQDDEWQPWLINAAYGTSFPAVSPAAPGKIMGWTDWVLSG